MITCHVSSIIVRLACAGNVKTARKFIARWAGLASVLASLLFAPPASFAHCDTLDGPVVAAARKALDSGDVNPVLMWVRSKDEGEIRQHFEKTLAVRRVNAQAQELADMYFFETLAPDSAHAH
ncbi:MAG: hypothetical protein RI988_3991 [Pseudomonadota bacterium]|jgi:uncharacterized membrane protein